MVEVSKPMMNSAFQFSIKDLLWITLVGAATTGWSIDHYLAATRHNADAAKIARLTPIEAAQQQKVDELRTKLFEEKARRRAQNVKEIKTDY